MIAKVQRPQAKPGPAKPGPAKPAPQPAAATPKVIAAVGAAGAAGGTGGPAKNMTKKVEAAAVEAIKRAYAEGVQDPAEIRRRVREASRAAMR